MIEGSYNLEDIPTFVALPLDALQNNAFQKPEQFQIIKNAIIKMLPDGSLYIMDANDLNERVPCQQIEFTDAPSSDTIQVQNMSSEESQIIVNSENLMLLQKPSSPIYRCPKCKEVFDKIALYRKHMMWHRNVKKYKCDKCSAAYNAETNLKIHLAMHPEGRPTCPICRISFQRLASLKSHLMLHQVEEMYTCDECGAEFEKEEELNKHLQNHQNNTVWENNNLVCSYCNVRFEDRKSFKEHITHHIKVKKMVLSGKKLRRTNGSKNNPHVCSVCLKTFSKLSLLERHLRVHSGERPFICEHCNKGFNQKGTLQIHLSKHTGIKPFQCTLCSAKFNQKGNLRVHVEKTHTAPMPGVKTYKCPHCTCIFKKIASLNVHITKCHASSEDVSDIDSVISQLKELGKQTAVMGPEKEMDVKNKMILKETKKCDASHTSYVRLAESFLDGTVKRYLVMQKKTNDVKWYVCSYCNKEFKKPSDLIRHTRIHTREKPFSCQQCGASFALKSTLFYHIKTHTDDSNYFCAICMKKFSSGRSLNMHLRKHAEKSQFKCPSCYKWFTIVHKARLHDQEVYNTENNLVLEVKQPLVNTSNGLLPVKPQKSIKNANQFQCPTCSTRFSKCSNLKRHKMLHNGEKNFKCDQCSKSYCTAHALKEHMLHHFGVRNFGCKICAKKFVTSSLLKRHLITHSTSKPYVCPHCNKQFKSVMLCRKHMNVHRKEINLQIDALKETEEIKNLNDTDKSKTGLPHFVSSDDTIILRQENTQTNMVEISNNNHRLVTQVSGKLGLTQENSSVTDQKEIDQQLYEIVPNSIEIITNEDKNLTHSSKQIETIFINCNDLQLTQNLYTQKTENMLFSPLNDIPDNTFSVHPSNINFDTQNIAYDSNQVISNEQKAVNITDLNYKVLSTNVNTSNKTKSNQNINVSNIILNDAVLESNVPYYSELNLLLNLDSAFETNNCDLSSENLTLADINLNEVPVFNMVSRQENKKIISEDDKKEKKSFSCIECSKVFTNKKMYMKHLYTHRDPKNSGTSLHSCNFCGKRFKKHSDLIRHIRTHTGEKPFACDKCCKSFSLKSTLLSHLRTHNPVLHKQFNCIVCNSFFSSKSSLKVHMSIHTGDKMHQCTLCSMRFRTAAHKKSHENNYHLNSSKKRTKKKITNLLASFAMDVLNHQEQDTLQNEQVFVSENLEKVVQEQMEFSEDQLTLSNDTAQNVLPEASQLEPLILQQFQSNLLLSDNLMPASLIQVDDESFLKSVNSEQDEQGQNVVSVGLQVEKPRNLACDICHKKYASKDVLRKHKRIHGIDKKFRCTKCEKGFDTEEFLKRHEKTHEGYRPYSCLYCTNSFSKERSLTTHVKRIHNTSLKDLQLYALK